SPPRKAGRRTPTILAGQDPTGRSPFLQGATRQPPPLSRQRVTRARRKKTMGSGRKSAMRGSLSRAFLVVLAVIAAVAVLAAGVAWQRPVQTKRALDYLHWFMPVDGRERTAAQKDRFDVL